MKSFLILIISSLLIIGCNKTQKDYKPQESDKKTVNQSDEQKTEDITKPESNMAGNTTSDFVTEIQFDMKETEKSITYEGNVVASVTWKDKFGVNILLVTESKEKEKGKNPSGERLLGKELYGYQFAKKDGEYELLWKIQDFIRECDFDLTLKYMKNSLTITDINKNGIAESTFLYRMSCKSDVSPDDMKLMMHEGKDKYAIRGSMILKIPGEDSYGGDMRIDAAFKNAPEGFLEYAKKQWNKFNTETL